MIIWTFTLNGEFFPDKWKRHIFKYLLDVEKEQGIKDHSEPNFERQFAGLMYLCEDTLTGQVIKYLDDEGAKEETAYNAFVFEKKNVLIALCLRTFTQDIPNFIFQFTVLGMSHELVSCEDSLNNIGLLISIGLTLCTSVISGLMYVKDYTNRENNFLTIL